MEGETSALVAPIVEDGGPPRDSGLVGSIVGHGTCRATREQLSEWRKRPAAGSERDARIAPSLLRYSDEQTIAGVIASFDAADRMGAEPARFKDWGLVAAPRYLGRSNLALTLQRFGAEGVWGTSPHLIPHFALHSASGTISQALGIQGPNIGVGGGLHSAAEGFLAALSWLKLGIVPGTLLVLSGWSPELRPARDGVPASAEECQALTLALVAEPGEARPRLRVATGAEGTSIASPAALGRLIEALCEGQGAGGGPIATDPTGRLRVEWVPAGAESAGERS